jgi:hypothetical protein
MKEKQIISNAMRLLGRRTSKRKARSSKRNGKLGGRPKTKPLAKIVPSSKDAVK